MTTIYGTYCPDLRCLQPILKKWIDLNKGMFASWRDDEDVPWWYNERASLSVLSGAVWRSGGEAFEEYSDYKRGISNRTGRLSNEYAGRIDFYFNVNGRDFKGESKFCWLSALASVRDQTEKLTSCLNEARNDARKSKPDGQERLGLVFISPYLPKKHKPALKERVDRVVDQIKTLKADAFAWVFPEIERCISYYGWLYPGTAVIVKRVQR